VTAERSPPTGEYSHRTTSCRRNDQPTIQLESTDTRRRHKQSKTSTLTSNTIWSVWGKSHRDIFERHFI